VIFRAIEMLVFVNKVMIGVTTSSLKHICSADINRPVMSKHIYKGPPLQTAKIRLFFLVLGGTRVWDSSYLGTIY